MKVMLSQRDDLHAVNKCNVQFLSKYILDVLSDSFCSFLAVNLTRASLFFGM